MSSIVYTDLESVTKQNQIIVFTDEISNNINESSWEELNNKEFLTFSTIFEKYLERISFEKKLPIYIEKDEEGNEHIVYNKNLLLEGKYYNIELSDGSIWAILKNNNKIKFMKLKKVSNDKENKSWNQNY